MGENHDLEDLLRRYRSGEREALDLVVRYLRLIGDEWLRKHAWNMSDTDREDVLQSALEALVRSVERFRGTTAAELRSYFFTILHNTVADLRRRRAQEGEPVPLEDLREPGRTHEDFGGVEVSEVLRRCLTPREHQVVKLKNEGFKEREISRILGIHPGTVATLLHRAREKLRKCLGRQETG